MYNGGSGREITGVEDMPLKKGQVVYSSSPGKMRKAQANSKATSDITGLVLDTEISANGSGVVQTDGVMTATAEQWSQVTNYVNGLYMGKPLYLSPTARGELTGIAPTTPGELLVQVGRAISYTELKIEIKSPILL